MRGHGRGAYRLTRGSGTFPGTRQCLRLNVRIGSIPAVAAAAIDLAAAHAELMPRWRVGRADRSGCRTPPAWVSPAAAKRSATSPSRTLPGLLATGVGRFIDGMPSQASGSKKNPGTWRAGASSQELSPKGGGAAVVQISRRRNTERGRPSAAPCLRAVRR